MAKWTDRTINSADGLTLHYRDYDGPRDRPPILCLPGLTRNARDFEPVADRFAGEWRVLCLDFRGRGGSEFDPVPANYHPGTYAADVLKLLDQLGIADAVFIGTSLGGLVTMVIAASDQERIAGAMLNDIGPEVMSEGIDRISGYVGMDTQYADWADATRQLAERNRDKFPNWSDAEWERFVRRVCREDENGKVRFDYDMRIADNFRIAVEQPARDTWSYYKALDGRPVLILRGALTDLLDAEVAERMTREIDDAELVTVPDVGHTPNLEEPESLDGIERLLTRVLARESAEA
ncbi:alpha/beta hydrolase [Sphingomonas sp. LY29]|uniref:alpha/beta fold hydrolase n=1 Tax=Sphingomonas sp. LY29 TaxID=3095341 RepID=UPI002D786170|nr:alpha/beta hydrolase [Sphingomonas sp. LY29]WRP26664.1 alpha/beta hydrolase [Sphingomonas sp. LY29]